LNHLRFLSINNNQLSILPKEIGNLKELRYFDIGKNNLSVIPYEIGQLESLVELNLAHCGAMVTLPESIQNCKSLEYLYIDKTTQLPFSIYNVNPRLKILVR